MQRARANVLFRRIFECFHLERMPLFVEYSYIKPSPFTPSSTVLLTTLDLFAHRHGHGRPASRTLLAATVSCYRMVGYSLRVLAADIVRTVGSVMSLITSTLPILLSTRLLCNIVFCGHVISDPPQKTAVCFAVVHSTSDTRTIRRFARITTHPRSREVKPLFACEERKQRAALAPHLNAALPSLPAAVEKEAADSWPNGMEFAQADRNNHRS